MQRTMILGSPSALGPSPRALWRAAVRAVCACIRADGKPFSALGGSMLSVIANARGG